MDDFQKKQLDELRSSKVYMDASIWTILYDLMDGEGGQSKEELVTIIDMINEKIVSHA